MDFCSGFISQTYAPFRVVSPLSVSRKAVSTKYYQARRCRVLASTSDGSSDSRQVFTETTSTDSAELLEPEFIEVGEGDEDEDMDVLSTLSADLDVFKQKRKQLRTRTRGFIDEITVEPETNLASDADRQPPIDEDETTAFVRTAVRSCDERKAEDIAAIRVSKLTYITSFIVVATGNNTPQIRAIANLVEENLFKKHGMHVKRRDGTANSGWLLLDYGDFMMNVFTPEMRAHYKLEALWKEGEVLDISDCITGPEERKDEEIPVSSLDDWITDSE